MGEYIQYKGHHVKLGTCENLYYSTYQQFLVALRSGQLFHLPNNDYPSNYARPDSGYRFRFPFPDEKSIEIGSYDDFYRGVTVKMDGNLFPEYAASKEVVNGVFMMDIVQQKLIHRECDGKLCLAVVWRAPKDKESFRVEEDEDMKVIIQQIIKHHVANNPDIENKNFYRQIAANILKGYRLNISETTQSQKIKTTGVKRTRGNRI